MIRVLVRNATSLGEILVMVQANNFLLRRKCCLHFIILLGLTISVNCLHIISARNLGSSCSTDDDCPGIFVKCLTAANASCGPSSTSSCHCVDVTRTCSSANQCYDGETCLYSVVFFENNYTRVCEECQYLDIWYSRDYTSPFPVTDIAYCNTTIEDSPGNVTIPAPNQLLSCQTDRDCPISYSCIAVTDKPRDDFYGRGQLNYSVVSCGNGDGFPCFCKSIENSDTCDYNNGRSNPCSLNTFCALTFKLETTDPETFAVFHSNCVHCAFLGDRQAPLYEPCDDIFSSEPPEHGKNASHLQSCLENDHCNQPLSCVTIVTGGSVRDCERQSHGCFCLEQERCATYFPCPSDKKCVFLPGTSISVCVPPEAVYNQIPTPKSNWTIPHWLIPALAAIELLFVILKTLLVLKKPSRHILKILIIAFFVLESIVGLGLTIYLSVVLYTISNVSFLNESLNSSVEVPGQWFLYQVGASFFLASELCVIVVETLNIRQKLSSRGDSPTHTSQRWPLWRRIAGKWFMYALSATFFIYFSINHQKFRYLDASKVISSISYFYRPKEIAVFAVPLIGTTIICFISAFLNSFLWIRLTVSLTFLSGIVLFSAISLLSSIFITADPPTCFFVHSVTESAALVVLYAGCLVSSIAGFRLVGYEEIEKLTKEQVEFSETVVISVTAPFFVYSTIPGCLDDSKQILLVAMPQMAALFIPFVFPILSDIAKPYVKKLITALKTCLHMNKEEGGEDS